MSDDEDELGEAFRREVQAMASDLQPSVRLLRRLEAIPDRRRARPSRTWILAPVGAVTVAIIVIVLILVAGSTSPTAQALTITAGGRTVRVTLPELAAVGPANVKLRSLRRVRAVVMTTTCPTSTRGINYAGVGDRLPPRISLGSPGGRSVTEIIAARQIGPHTFILAIGAVNGNAPSCVSSHGVGPGLPGWHLKRERLASGSSGSAG